MFVNGVPQEEGRDYEVDGRELVFDRPLEKERLGFWRWTAIFLALFGTYGKNDTVDVQYTVGGRSTVATGPGHHPARLVGPIRSAMHAVVIRYFSRRGSHEVLGGVVPRVSRRPVRRRLLALERDQGASTIVFESEDQPGGSPTAIRIHLSSGLGERPIEAVTVGPEAVADRLDAGPDPDGRTGPG